MNRFKENQHSFFKKSFAVILGLSICVDRSVRKLFFSGWEEDGEWGMGWVGWDDRKSVVNNKSVEKRNTQPKR